MVVVTIGSVEGGFGIIGPFADTEEATRYIASEALDGLYYEVLELLAPKKKE